MLYEYFGLLDYLASHHGVAGVGQAMEATVHEHSSWQSAAREVW